MTLSDLIRTRLEAGAREYGDKSEQRHPLDLLREIREELADVLGWLVIARKACINHRIDPAIVDEHEPALRVLMETADDVLASLREALGGGQELSTELVVSVLKRRAEILTKKGET